MPNLEYISISTSAKDYLKASWLTSRDETAPTNALAEQLGIAAPSVSAMLGKLQGAGFVNHERYRGVTLTERGKREALRLLRRHRLVETFLLEPLSFSWDEVQVEAERLEHVVSDRFTERLADFLGYPSHDPHGDPIPNPGGTLPGTPDTPLAKVEVNQALRVSRLLSQASDVLSDLANLGIRPGTRLKVVQREPVGGPVHVAAGDNREVLHKVSPC